MKQINYRSLMFGAALVTLLSTSGTAYAIGEQACESESRVYSPVLPWLI